MPFPVAEPIYAHVPLAIHNPGFVAGEHDNARPRSFFFDVFFLHHPDNDRQGTFQVSGFKVEPAAWSLGLDAEPRGPKGIAERFPEVPGAITVGGVRWRWGDAHADDVHGAVT